MDCHSVFCCSKKNLNFTKQNCDDMALIKIKQGLLRGVHCEGIEKYVAFKGIPFAKPPVGDLRFKAPEPPETWDGIRDASRHGPVCPQYDERMDRLEPGNEDCLYLNVYTKNLSPAKPFPVMVWIHGGGFYTGSGNSEYYGPDFLLAQDVILVTFNYRLEALGFLCLDTEEVPGNAGLKDQVLALKWVKNNIAAFGGDPNNVTIFGCSAGAASTSYHLISQMSKGLFDKAICQSGICLNDWSYNIYAQQRAFQLGKALGCDTDDPHVLLNFLRQVPAMSLVKVNLPQPDVQHKDVTDGILYGPVIEKSHLNVEHFITESPVISVKDGRIAKIPLMLGYTSGEGIEIARSLEHMLTFLSTVGSIVPRELKTLWPSEKIEQADEQIRKYYLKGQKISLDVLQEIVDLQTVQHFLYNIVRFARYLSYHSSAPIHLYKFTLETERNYTKKVYKMNHVKGVCHADDLPYLFNVTNLYIPITDDSRSFISHVTKLWTNFAKTGNPTPTKDVEQWKPFSDCDRYCYVIGNSGSKCEQNVDDETIKLWDNVYGERVP